MRPTTTPRPSRARPRGGFSLIELIAVLVIVSIVSISIAPAIGSMGRMSDAGLRDEVARRFALARAYAMSTGRPAGLEVDAASGQLNLVYIPTSGANPLPIPGPTGAADPSASLAIESIFPGTAITDADLDGANAHDTLWFDYEGTPHLRTSAGAFVQSLAQDATVTTAGGSSVTVRRVTGAIQ